MFKVTDDDFFEQLYINYAKIIYKIIGFPFDLEPGKEERKISLKKLKKNICKAEGYERDILALIYGSIGIMSLDSKTQFMQQGKIQLQDLSDTSASVITGMVPDGKFADPCTGEDFFSS